MVRKKLAVAILALSALQAGIAGAMGLGNLSVKSALNQPLNAEIKLIETGDLDPSQIKIRLASQEDFQRAGVDRDFFLTNLHFDVNMDGKGGGTIRITTREPVIEPYLNFVIEARWPNGRLLREFAVLLDPPTFSDNKAMVPVAPATTTGATGAKPRAVQPPTVTSETEVTKSAPPADMSLPTAEKSGEYRVQVYDTLSKIAARFKPASDVSVAQTMIAIQRANPNVFIRNNINLIKSGYVLRLPSADEARAISAEQATQDVDTQIQEWRGSRSSGAAATKTATGPQLDASAPEPSTKEGGYREQARLSIATAGDSNKGGSGGGSGKGVDALRQQLTESQEALEKGKRDNKELQSRLDDMERQIATLQRLITLKDEQLAALQTKSTGAKPAAQPVAEPEKPAATEPSVAAAPTPAPAPEASAPAPAPAPKPAPVKPVPPPVKPQPAPEVGLASKLIADPAYLYGGIGVLLLALLSPLVFKRLKKREEEAESDTLSLGEGDQFSFDTGAFEESQGEDEETFGAEAEEVAQPAAEAQQKPVRSETGDPIAESDIYIAYGRYQQAVDLLTTAIDSEPHRSDLRTKLLEVYVEMRNKDAFRQQFVALQGLGDSDAIAHVKDLLSSVDGISDWLDDLPGGSVANAAGVVAEKVDVEPDLDLDLDFDVEDATEQAAIADIDTNFGGNVEALESSFAGELGTTDEENPVELDLDLDQEAFAGGLDTELAESSPKEPEGGMAPPVFEVPNVEPAADAESGLELDLGDEDLDIALDSMGDTDTLDDLDDMSTALGDLEALPEEFDLSQHSIELPDVDRASDFGELSFDEPSPDFGAEPEETAAVESEIDVFAGLGQSAESGSSLAEQSVDDGAAAATGDDFDFLADADEVSTKLDLARAYIDMGDTEGARDILDEVMSEGTDTQKQEASTLLARIG